MLEPKNSTCKDGSDDIWGTSRPRDVRLQIYLSFSLGLFAFLTFCVRSPRLDRLHTCSLTALVPPPTMEGALCGTQEAERPCDIASRAPR